MLYRAKNGGWNTVEEMDFLMWRVLCNTASVVPYFPFIRVDDGDYTIENELVLLTTIGAKYRLLRAGNFRPGVSRYCFLWV